MDTNYIHKILKYFVDNTSELSIKKVLEMDGMDINSPDFGTIKTNLETQLNLHEFIHSQNNNGQYRITSNGRQAYQYGDPIGYIEKIKTKFENEIELAALSKEVARMQKEEIPKNRKRSNIALIIAAISLIIAAISLYFKF